MARSDQLLDLIKAANSSDRDALERAVTSIAEDARSKQHHILADRLLDQLNAVPPRKRPNPKGLSGDQGPLLREEVPKIALDDLILSPFLRQIIDEIVEEQHRSSLLRSYGIEPRHRILLAGPPGNGKTSIAEALANSLMVPLLTVRYEGVVGSFLGETASRLQQLFDYARSMQCVLFFDEFDVLAKERGDAHETGEIKRVVSSLLLQVDQLPSYCVVITATNHSELLDRAVWRRFQVRLEMHPPDQVQVRDWIKKFEDRMSLRFGLPYTQLSERLNGLSFSELEDFGLDVYRRLILSNSHTDLFSIVESRLAQLDHRLKTPT